MPVFSAHELVLFAAAVGLQPDIFECRYFSFARTDSICPIFVVIWEYPGQLLVIRIVIYNIITRMDDNHRGAYYDWPFMSRCELD